MSENREANEIFQRLAEAVGNRSAKELISVHKSGKCDENLVSLYVSGGLSDAKMKIAEAEIFGCSKCTLLALELAKAVQDVDGNLPEVSKLDHAGFARWREQYEKEHSYTINRKYGKTELKFTVKGWSLRIDNVKADFSVRIGKKTYSPNKQKSIECPYTEEAVLESSDAPPAIIRDLIGV